MLGCAQVAPGNRKDYEHIKLWRAVGNSPLREIAMKTRDLPPTPQRLICHSLRRITPTKQAIQLDLNTMLPGPEMRKKQPNPTQLFLTPAQAKRLAKGLVQAVQSYEKNHGVIAMPQPAQPNQQAK